MKKAIAFLAVLTLISGSAFAASGESYGDKAKDKLVYGLKNLALGWTEILQETGEAVQAKTCPIKGLGNGVYNAVGDTVGGALHVVTFFAPDIKVPLPEGGTDIMGSSATK